MNNINTPLNQSSVIGYGTFITRGYWKNKLNVEVCLVKDFIRIYPERNWFPFILSSKGFSFYALKFDISQEELRELDYYEGVSQNYFKREIIEVYLKENRKIQAYIYMPTKMLIKIYKLSPNLDKNDRWKEKIKKFPEIIEKFPELVI